MCLEQLSLFWHSHLFAHSNGKGKLLARATIDKDAEPQNKKKSGLMLRTRKGLEPGLTPVAGPGYSALSTKQSAFLNIIFPSWRKTSHCCKTSGGVVKTMENDSHVLRTPGPCLSVISGNTMAFLNFCGFYKDSCLVQQGCSAETHCLSQRIASHRTFFTNPHQGPLPSHWKAVCLTSLLRSFRKWVALAAEGKWKTVFSFLFWKQKTVQLVGNLLIILIFKIFCPFIPLGVPFLCKGHGWRAGKKTL